MAARFVDVSKSQIFVVLFSWIITSAWLLCRHVDWLYNGKIFGLMLIYSLTDQQAYSVYDKEVGYCQGSAFIVGILLMQVLHTSIKIQKLMFIL